MEISSGRSRSHSSMSLNSAGGNRRMTENKIDRWWAYFRIFSRVLGSGSLTPTTMFLEKASACKNSLTYDPSPPLGAQALNPSDERPEPEHLQRPAGGIHRSPGLQPGPGRDGWRGNARASGVGSMSRTGRNSLGVENHLWY